MAKLDPKSLKFPEFDEEVKNVIPKEEMDKILKRIKIHDSSFPENDVRHKLEKYELHLNKIRCKAESFNDYPSEKLTSNIKKKKSDGNTVNKQTLKNEPDETDENGTNLLSSKTKMYNYLMKEKKACENLEKELNLIQEKLSNVDLSSFARDGFDPNLLTQAKTEINNVLEDFEILEMEMRSEMENRTSDESESDYENDLKELHELQKETQTNLGFPIDI